ncbi:MAG: glycoside hydrolase family 13 protein [Oscillospiraceae bacterium]|jgi:glycosidase|nr:glycoside hydrolase family 13 protein [Oscillospiraceae bacterium]
MHFVPFRSRSELHKTPFGAVAAGEEVTFRVVLPRHLGCRGVTLHWGDYDGAWERAIGLVWAGMQGAHEEWWQCAVTVEAPALLRYRFAFAADSGGGVIGDTGAGVGRIGAEGYWQLTVFDPATRLPEWVRGGVLYQIFPDRFCASGRAKQGVPPGRVLRDDWGGAPLWAPDDAGKITVFDFFGGDLEGIRAKLGYLKGLGVTCLYINPIFFARSNHRYDTADYLRVDPLLGTEEDFAQLCAQAHRLGIRVLLDAVCSHTGDDSVYFNKHGNFLALGAYQSKESPYYDWYQFRRWPDDYACWWGVDILPELRESHEGVLDFFAGKNGVARKWLRAGADGYRLDVADELPDVFLDRFFAAARDENPDAFVLGEVWEDASNKHSHGGRRRFLLGRQMHSVMNYPLAEAILAFALARDAEGLAEVLQTQQEQYPPCALHGLMNHIGTHDTMRALVRLADLREPGRTEIDLPPERYAAAAKRLQLCAALQYTLPGNPCVYYGDEAGLQGGMDPFNRGCYPWGGEDAKLVEYYRQLGALRHKYNAFAGGALVLVSAAQGCVAFLRRGEPELLVIANANDHAIAYAYCGTQTEVPAVDAAVLERTEEGEWEHVWRKI